MRDGELILVVEDNVQLGQVLVRQLRQLGYRTVLAENAWAALETLETNNDVRLLLTDVVMPGGMSGIELAREARLRQPRLRVLLSSGFLDIRTALGNSSAWVPHLLSKPYRKEELGRVLRQVLEDPVAETVTITDSVS